mgnify:CR=1 FL=1|tara:strand:- start:110 stop:1450 length:1341 start_codon:yes stop_codon:yes gene_type:complete
MRIGYIFYITFVILFVNSCGSSKSTFSSYNSNSSSNKSTNTDYNSENRYSIERFRDLKAAKQRVYKDYFSNAQDAFYADNWSLAIKYLDIVINTKPDADAYWMRAYSKSRLNNHTGAVDDYLQATKLRVDFVYAYNNLAYEKYNYFNIIESSIRDLEKAIYYDNTYALAYYNTAVIQNTAERYEESVKNSSRAISLNFKDIGDAYRARGKGKNGLEQYRDAIVDLKIAISYNSKDASAYFELGNSYLELNENQNAILNFSLAITYKPNFPEAYNNRAIAKQISGDYSGSISDYNMANTLNPDKSSLDKSEIGDVYFSWGSKYFDDENYSDAIEKYKEAKKLNSSLISICDSNISISYYNIANTILRKETPIISRMNSLGSSTLDYNIYDNLKEKLHDIYREAIPYLLLAYKFDKNRKDSIKQLSSLYKAIDDMSNYRKYKAIANEL